MKNDEINRDVVNWANKLGLNIIKELGRGLAGVAYLTDDNKVIKQTTHSAEFFLAMKMQGKINENVVDVYKTKYIDEDSMLILMEKLDMEYYIKEVFETLESVAEDNSLDILEISEELAESSLSDDEICFLCDIKNAVKEIMSATKDFPVDIHGENIGIKENGNFALIDQFNSTYNEDEFQKMIKRKNKKSLKL